MIVLGIETSCDETAAAVVDDARRIHANVVLSQIAEHRPYGGVVPEIAARAHVEQIDGLIQQAMAEAELNFTDLDGIAATAGPGLIGGVMVGLVVAFSGAYVSEWSMMSMYLLLIAVITFRTRGLFGKKSSLEL